MGRPKTRTEVLDAEELRIFHENLGSSTHAYRRLIPGGQVSYPDFLRAWRGLESRPDVIAAIRDGWENFSTRMVMIVRERQKEPVA